MRNIAQSIRTMHYHFSGLPFCNRFPIELPDITVTAKDSIISMHLLLLFRFCMVLIDVTNTILHE